MLSNSKQVHYEIKSLHVPTPKWRILEIDSSTDLSDACDDTASAAATAVADDAVDNKTKDHSEQIEPLDDLTFINRHKLKELKERDTTLKFKNNKIGHKANKNKSKSSASINASLSMPNESSSASATLLLSSSSSS